MLIHFMFKNYYIVIIQEKVKSHPNEVILIIYIFKYLLTAQKRGLQMKDSLC